MTTGVQTSEEKAGGQPLSLPWTCEEVLLYFSKLGGEASLPVCSSPILPWEVGSSEMSHSNWPLLFGQRYLASLCVSFFICKMGIRMPTSWTCCEK